MKNIIMVAEKPSLAKSIADLLSNNRNREIKITGKSVYEWRGRFNSEEVVFKMTSVYGHVFAIDFSEEYNKHIDPALLFDGLIVRKEAMPKLRVPSFLRGLAKNNGDGTDAIILWLDCDKEGENICFEVLDIVGPYIKRFRTNPSSCVFRAHFSALTPSEIRTAMANLGEPNQLEARSVDARQELDLRIGCAFTRLQTQRFKALAGQGAPYLPEGTVLSFGPCQTPTLGLCVARQDFIKNFQSEPYWTLRAYVTLQSATTSIRRDFKLTWARGRIFDKEVAQAFLDCCKATNKGLATVVNVAANIKTSEPPLPLNTVNLLRVGSSAYGLSPHTTMELAERLYTGGYLSYPRTETTAYPEAFDFGAILRAHRSRDSSLTGVVDTALGLISRSGGPKKVGKNVGDHPPITPTTQVLPIGAAQDGPTGRGRGPSKEALKLYDYVFTHFLATLLGDAKYLEYVTTFDINGDTFTYQHREMVEAGYLAVMPWKAAEILGNSEGEDVMPEFKEGRSYKISKIEMCQLATQPPPLLTESELIKLMEKHGIGTDASIPVHIKKIVDRTYVTVGSGRLMRPTALGVALVRGYETIDVELVLPTMRAAMEKELELIAKGTVGYDQVVQHALRIYAAKYQFYAQNLGAITGPMLSQMSQGSHVNQSSSRGRGGGSRGRGRGRGRRGPHDSDDEVEVRGQDPKELEMARVRTLELAVVKGANGYVSQPIYNTDRLKKFA